MGTTGTCRARRPSTWPGHTLEVFRCASCFSSEIIDIEAAALKDALEGSDRERLVSMQRDNYLTTIRMPPFLMTALLADQHEAVSIS
jgi:hypothetical protein